MLKKIYKVNYSFKGTGEALIEAKTEEEARMKFEDNEVIPDDGAITETPHDYKIDTIKEFTD